MSQIPLELVNLDLARERYGTEVDEYAHYFYATDPLADAVIDDFEELGWQRGFEMLARALDRGIDAVADAPKSLRALFRQADRVPDWVDWERVDLGARTFQRGGIHANVVLSAVSLMVAYRSSVANKPLLFTRALEQMAPRRLAETGRFVVAVCQENGLRRDAEGFKLAIRVRLMHAKVRHLIQRSPRWNAERWGAPINQANMAGTTMLFSLALVDGLRKLGFHISSREGAAVMHLWRYAGWLSGVDERLLFDDEDSARHLYELGSMIQPGADEGGRALAAALSRAPQLHARNPVEAAVGRVVVRYIDGMAWALNGADLASDLRIQHKHWRHAIHLSRLMIRPLEGFRRTLPFGSELFAAWGNRTMHHGIAVQLRGLDADFKPPVRLPSVPPPSVFRAA
ncbi:MAG: DUF2236 domain-containing protein [Polyangiaceae bacterium]|nr:DUF2236 domain-containing protein [Polyangiaceae bacterium]